MTGHGTHVEKKSIVTVVFVAFLLVLNGCSRKAETGVGSDCSHGQNCTGVSTGDLQASTRTEARSAVSRIVFIDLEEGCDCTRRRIEASWGALQSAMGKQSSIPVDRIHLDSQEALVEPCREQKPFQVIPAVYFMDANQNVIEVLQGEPSEKQISDVLKGKTS